MTPNFPITADIVLIGGGHTHALVLKSWAKAPLPGIRLTLITPTPTAAYSGMLPGHIAGHYESDDLLIDLVQLSRFAGARIILSPATAIDTLAKTVSVPDRAPIGYDFLSIDIGVHSDMPSLPGFSDYGSAAKPLDRFAAKWQSFAGAGGGPVAIVGGGIAGVELAMAARHRLGPSHPVSLIDRREILSDTKAKARTRLIDALSRQGIALFSGADITAITASSVTLSDGQSIPAAFTIGAAGARPHAWLARQGLPHENGYLTVGPTLQSPADPTIFAVGDCAHLSHDPRPKAGVFAVRAAPVLTANLRAVAQGRLDLIKEFHPQKDYLKLVSLGDRRALAEKAGIVLTGLALWKLKDSIDQKFMKQFKDLSPMAVPILPQDHAADLATALGSQPLCGGCGAKIGSDALSVALRSLPAPKSDSILSQPGDDAAILKTGGAMQVLTTDHLRGFTEDPGLLARIAAIHALGDIWAMGADPQAATATIILPRLSDRLQSRWLAEIMAEASSVFEKTGASIVGGHTSMGAELTIGFTVTGLAEDTLITLEGAQPGETLVLTKPLGTGVILSAEMQLAADGETSAAAWAAMQTDQTAAARILAPIATAMTDVTGFGLAGHLMNICRASNVAAQLDLNALPALPGALRLLEKGHASTLAPANIAALKGISDLADSPCARLAYDPQTAGGLLASIPSATADATLAALRQAGANAAIIGEVKSGPPRLLRA